MVTWQGRWDSVRQGGVVAALVTVRPGEPAEAVLSRRYTQDSAAVLVVEVLGDAELEGREYRSLGWFTGVTCDTRSEELARRDLALKAGRKGADAVGHVECRRLGLSLKYNCMGRIECVGEGIGWG